MAYVDPDSLGEEDAALVYVAGKTSEARGVEELFARYEVEYTIRPTPFLRSSLFGGMIELPGVGFYVAAEQAGACRHLLQNHKFKVGLILEGEE